MTKEEFKDNYGKNIKRLRNEKGFTQEVLSEKIGLGEKYLSAIEIGAKWGSFDTLLALANALEVEPYELLLPQNKSLNYDSRKTKELMKQLRKNLDDTVSTIENFLTIDRK